MAILPEDISDQLRRLTISESDVEFLRDQNLGRGAYGIVFKARYRGSVCAAKEIHSILIDAAYSPAERRRLIPRNLWPPYIGHASVKIEFDVAHCIYRMQWHHFYLLQIFSTSAQLKLYVHIQHCCGDTIFSVYRHVHRTYIMLTTTVLTYIVQNISKPKDRVSLLQSPIST